MDDSSQNKKPPVPSVMRWLFQRNLPLENETLWFVFVSALDIFFTYLLVGYFNFRESNPVAEYILNHWGMRGVVYFKMSTVAVVAVIAQIIAPKSMITARRLLQFATLIVGAVVTYSAVLLVRTAVAV